MLADASNSLLVLIDVQERLAAAMDPAGMQSLTKNAAILLQSAACLGVPILATEQYRKGLGPTIAPLASLLPETVQPLEKTTFSCACDRSFADRLQSLGLRQAILAGMESHVCVLQSALELRQSDYEVFVVADACCSRNPRNHANAMDRLRAAGVVVTNTESVVFEWLRNAGHASFKALSALLR